MKLNLDFFDKLCTKTTKNAFNSQKHDQKRPQNPNSGVQSEKQRIYHIVDKVQNSYENTLKFDLIDNVVYVVFALYSRILKLFLSDRLSMDCTILFYQKPHFLEFLDFFIWFCNIKKNNGPKHEITDNMNFFIYYKKSNQIFF
jgi:hypothetical protein